MIDLHNLKKNYIYLFELVFVCMIDEAKFPKRLVPDAFLERKMRRHAVLMEKISSGKLRVSREKRISLLPNGAEPETRILARDWSALATSGQLPHCYANEGSSGATAKGSRKGSRVPRT